jgi:hypothetical protein
MVAQVSCPEPELIRDLLLGDLPDHEHDEMARHFDVCSACQKQFENEAAGPDFLGDVARLGASPLAQESATLERLRRDIPQELCHLQDPINVPAPETAAVEAEPKPARQPKRLWLALALLFCVSIFGVTEAAGVTNVSEWLGIILKLKTPDGTLVVDIEDPNVKVSVDGDEVVITGVGKHEIRLKPGKHQWTTKRGGKEVSEWVTIERDGKTLVRVKQLPPDVATNRNTPEFRKPTQVQPFVERPSKDGLVFAEIMRSKRFGPNEILSLNPLGKLTFLNIPEQLWGQNYAFNLVEGGVFRFEIVQQYPGDKSRQRLWLLVPEQGRQTEATNDDLPLDSAESLKKRGWRAWQSIISHHALTDPKVLENQIKWQIYFRDAAPNEKFSIRTHKDHTPMLVWGSLQLENVIVETQWDQRVARFDEGVTVPLGNGHHIFDEIPEFLVGKLYTKRNGYTGITRFTIRQDQRVTIGLYDWKAMNDGNSSGGWKEELTSPEGLLEEGWKQVATLKARHSNPKIEGTTWYFYSRDCKANESFSIRNHKYQSPIVFSERANISNGPASGDSRPNGTARDENSPRVEINKTKTTSGAINLDANRVTTFVAPPIDKPGIFNIAEHSKDLDLRALYHQCVCENLPKGHHFLVAQLDGNFDQNTTINVARFTRVGSRISLSLRSTTFHAAASGDANAQAQIADAQDAELTAKYVKFFREHPNHKDLDRTLLAFARHLIYLASKADVKAATDLLAEARGRLATARKLLETSKAAETARIKVFPVFIDREKEPRQFAQRRATEMQLINVEFQLADCRRIEAETYEPKSQARFKVLKEAEQDFAQIHAKYRTQLGGLYARLWQGRCLQLLNDKQATEIFAEILSHKSGESSAMRSLQDRALLFLLLQQNVNNDAPQQVIEKGTAWFTKASQQVRMSDEAAGILREISRAMIASLDEEQPALPEVPRALHLPSGSAERRRALQLALDHFRRVKASTGRYSPIAKMWEQDVLALLGDDVAAKLIPTPKQSLYVQIRLPLLPPGDYQVDASIRSSLRPNGKRISVAGNFAVAITDPMANQLKLLAVRSIMIRPSADSKSPSPQTQVSTGLDLKTLLEKTGQNVDVKNFPKDNSGFEEYCARLRLEGKLWALCATLDHPNVDAKIYAARELSKLRDPNSVPVLLAAAKRNNFGVDGSESATLHSIYRLELKKALESTTGLNLTPAGLKLQTISNGETITYTSKTNPEMFREEVAFDRVDQWLRDTYISDAPADDTVFKVPKGANRK